MNFNKYFWSLNPRALKETGKILKNPGHPKFVERALTLLSRCDKPKEVFSAMGRHKFIDAWPALRRRWGKTNLPADFQAWWETVYEQLQDKNKTNQHLKGAPSQKLIKIGSIIKAKRLSKNISQSDFAMLAGMRQPDISAIEAGKKNLTLETLARLCKILSIKSLPFA